MNMKNEHAVSDLSAFQAKHGLGQNFLRDRQVLNRITDTARSLLMDTGPSPADTLCVEIGPGTGQLTAGLLEAGFRVTALEIDERLKPVLLGRLGANERFRLIMGDAGATDLRTLVRPDQSAAVLGISNLPYYITTPLVIQYLSELPEALGFIFMVQADVLTRLRPSRNKKDSIKRRGPVQILGEAYGTVEVVQQVAAGAFDPAPRVGSVLLAYRPAQITTEERAFYLEHPKTFVRYLETVFTQRRRTMSNNLKAGLEQQSTAYNAGDVLEYIFRSRPELAGQRAEQLSVEEHLRIARRWQECLTQQQT